MRIETLAAVLATAFMATSASATMINVTGYDPAGSLGIFVTVTNGGVTKDYNVQAGPLQISVDGNPSLVDVFCADFFTSIGYQGYTVNVAPPSTAALQTAADMYATFISEFNSASGFAKQLDGAALQIALWEVLVDGYNPGSATDLSTGNFKESNSMPFSADLHNTVNRYLTSSILSSAPGVVIYTGKDSQGNPIQTLLGGGTPSPTPEPGTWAMLGSGFVALGLLRRKK